MYILPVRWLLRNGWTTLRLDAPYLQYNSWYLMYITEYYNRGILNVLRTFYNNTTYSNIYIVVKLIDRYYSKRE